MSEKLKKCYACKDDFEYENIILCKGHNYCKNCFNQHMQNNKYKNKIKEYYKEQFGVLFMSSYIWKQIKDLRNCELKLNYKQVLYCIHYTYKIKKLYNPKFNYTIAIVFDHVLEALDYAAKKNIDMISLDEDYFSSAKENEFIEIEKEKKKLKEEQLDQEEKIRIKEKELEEKRLAYIKKQDEIDNMPIDKILECDLESYLISNLNKIEDGMTYIDHQVQVDGGILDILAFDKNHTKCIIELKINKDCKDAIFQASYYPTCFTENTRMLIVAPDYSKRVFTVLKDMENIELYKYDLVYGIRKEPIKDIAIKRIK